MILVAQCLLRPGEHHLNNAGVRVLDGRIDAVGTVASHRFDDCLRLGGRESLFSHYRTQNPARYLDARHIMGNALGIFSRATDVM